MDVDVVVDVEDVTELTLSLAEESAFNNKIPALAGAGINKQKQNKMANKNLFNSIKLTKPRSNHFDLSHDVKLTMDMGTLVPVMCLETVPGDKFNISCETLVRFAPLIAPVMHRMDITIHYFFVPNRLLWDNWEKYISPSTSADAAIVHPYTEYGDGAAQYALLDYLGIPPITSGSLVRHRISPFPMAAYQFIYNEYYRDQNLQAEVPYKLIDGDQSGTGGPASAILQIKRRAWEHDYFTSALPWAQKGNPVQLPLTQVGDVPVYRNVDGTTYPETSWPPTTPPTGSVRVDNDYAQPLAGTPIDIEHLFAKTSDIQAQATTVNDLRRAFRLQEWLEKNARAGTRYIENILAHFGVRSSDKRLQRPEYITGVKSPIVVSEVLNSTGETGGLPQGNMAGHAVGVTSGNPGHYFCEEHGLIMGIMSVLPKPAYHQGIPRMFIKGAAVDSYYWPSFANIGEQPVYNKEIFADNSYGEGIFGYVPRYAEYKYQANRVAGDFRGSLLYWTLVRDFDSSAPPQLNSDFVTCTPRTDIFAVEDPEVNNLYVHCYNKVHARRPMPKFGTPMF